MPILAVGPGTGREITLGSIDFTSTALGVAFRGMKLEGWDGSPGSTLQLTQKLRGPGAWRSSDPQRGPKTLTLSGTMVALDGNVSATTLAFDALNAAVTLDETSLIVDGHGVGARRVNVSRQGDVIDVPMPSILQKGFNVQLVAADPRKFGTNLKGSTGLPASSGGLSFPMSFPSAFTSTVVSGQVALTNPGNETGPVVMRVTGPCTGPVITHVGSGLSLVFSSSLVLGAGEWIDIDMEARTVLANGQSGRAQWVTSRGWSGFDPGQNVWAFTAQAYDSASQLSVTATPAWI